MLNGRGSGILLHITSLPSAYGIGDLGPAAYQFIDFLKAAGQRYWQILPLNPTSDGHDNSPYQSVSAFACSTLLISPELLEASGLLGKDDLAQSPVFPPGVVDYLAVQKFRGALFARACERFREGRGDHSAFGRFCRENEWWLEDYSLFAALHRHFDDRPWSSWPEEIRFRHEPALIRARADLARAIEEEKILQFLVHSQWQALRGYAAGNGISIIGDMPIYVDYDSADLWVHPELFRLDPSLSPIVVAGVPPDYFSATGQLWNNPLYAWEEHRKTGFSWWLSRMKRALSCMDYVRIDHFRGLVAFWEIPAGSTTAAGGRWVNAPGRELLTAIKARFPVLPVIAEDLGIITPDVRELMQEFGLPGMRVLLFAFTGDPRKNPNAPHNIPKNVLLYTGTHDNAPVRGWYEEGSTEPDRERVIRYLGSGIHARNLPEILIRLAMISPADTVIIPMQDLLCLGMEARMNTPGTEKGNWRWRLSGDQISRESAELLRMITTLSDRTK